MKIIVVKNKISTSLKTRLKEVVKFFDGVIDIGFTEEKSNFKNIPQSKYGFVHIDNTHKYYYSVDETWYDENISKPYQKQGYDVAILLLRETDWQYEVYNADGSIYKVITVAGFGNMDNNCGIEEISMPYDTRGTYNFNGVKLKGDKLTWTIIHELLHRFYEMKGLTDNTHKYFLEGKPEKCLEDFKENTRVILTRLNDNGIQTTGAFDAYNNGKNMVCYSLELPWKDNKRNISCIPKGTYKCTLYNSTKFGKVYKVLDVHGRTGILIHVGNYNSQIKGCILLGNDLKDINKDGQKDVINSRLTLSKFMLFMGGKDFTLIIK